MKIIRSYLHFYDCHIGQNSALRSTQLSDDMLCFSLGSHLTLNSEHRKGKYWSRDCLFELFGIICNIHVANPSYQWRPEKNLLITYAHPLPPPQATHHLCVLLTITVSYRIKTPVFYRVAADFLNYSCNIL